jgi:hypothetical protein
MNSIVDLHIWHHDPYHLHKFFCHPHPSLRQGSMTLPGTGNFLLCNTHLKAEGICGYSIDHSF